MRPSLGIVMLLVGVGVAVVGLGRYEAWWTVVLPIAGAVITVLERRRATASAVDHGQCDSPAIAD